MKKLVLNLALTTISFLEVNSISAQCSSYGSSSPQINQVMSPTSILNGVSLVNSNNAAASKKIIGDWNGDGLDDIFIYGLDNQNSFYNFKVFLSNGFGGFNFAWTSTQTQQTNFQFQNINNSPLSSLDLGSTFKSSWKFISGNFTGNSKDELLIIQPTTNPTGSFASDAFWILLTNLDNSTPTVLASKLYQNSPNFMNTKISSAHLDGDFYSANLVGDGLDELFSTETVNNVSSWYLLSFVNTNNLPYQLFSSVNNGNWVGNYQFFPGMDNELQFVRLNPNDQHDKLFAYQKNGSWAMIEDFVYNGTNGNFTWFWHNGGCGSLFLPNQCGYPNYNVTWNTGTKLMFGNWDDCNQNYECLLIDNNTLGNCASFEFDWNASVFKCWSVKWPDLQNRGKLDDDDVPVFACTVMERYQLESTCCGWFMGITGGICIKHCGGSGQAPYNFYHHGIKDGPLQLLTGNFYDNNINNGFSLKTTDLLVFRNQILRAVPQQICDLPYFFSSAGYGGLQGDNIPSNGNVTISDIINSYGIYNVNTGFQNGPISKFAVAAMYSLTNPNIELRPSHVKDSTYIFTENNFLNANQNVNTAYSPSPNMSEGKNVLMIESKNPIRLKVLPSPANEKIDIEVYSSKNLGICKILILNSEGNIVENFNYNFELGFTSATINVASLAKGVYIVKFETFEGKIHTTKFIKD